MGQGFFHKLGWKRGGLIACGAFCVGILVGWAACWFLQYLQAHGAKIDQSALATFATGLLAVGAALFVGMRQTEIQAKQVEIQERQIANERDLRVASRDVV